jgi:hypothetical protein
MFTRRKSDRRRNPPSLGGGGGGCQRFIINVAKQNERKINEQLKQEILNKTKEYYELVHKPVQERKFVDGEIMLAEFLMKLKCNIL